MSAPWHPDEALSGAAYSAAELDRGATRVWLLDQRLLPAEERYLDCDRTEQVWDAIKVLAVRGAPAIGVAAAYGVVLGVQAGRGVGEVADYLASHGMQRSRMVTIGAGEGHPVASNDTDDGRAQNRRVVLIVMS